MIIFSKTIPYLMFCLHGFQMTVVLTHFLDKSLLKRQNFIQLNQFFRHLSLPQCMLGSVCLGRIFDLSIRTAALKVWI